MKSAHNTSNPYKNLCPKKAKFSLCFGIRERFKAVKVKETLYAPRFFVMLVRGFFLVLKNEKNTKKRGYVVATNPVVFGF